MVLDFEIDMLEREGQRFEDRRLARVFGGDVGVVRELKRLREWNNAAEHFEIGPYHNALLYSFVVEAIAGLPEELLVFGDGRYRVKRIDDFAFEESFFPDTDFELPPEKVNAFGAAEKFVLGVDEATFGVVNGLPPHAKELRARRGDPKAVEPIGELTEAQDAALRRRHKTAPEAVWRELGAMGVIYQRGQVFPYLPGASGTRVGDFATPSASFGAACCR